MTERVVDLRSDTVTRPTPAMREAMASATVGDDVYGEDPTLSELESEVAQVLGKEAALFVPSGTMANQIALQLHARRGDSVLCEERSHIFLYEAGGGAALAGVQFDSIALSEELSDASLRAAVREEELHAAPTALLVVENTHNRGGGRALAKQKLDRITATARRLGLKCHCDGARLWNAAVATGCSEAELAAGFDTVAVCFSKGLGAPVGSALAGPRQLIERARKIRKRLGGGMRQAGIIAAGALYALQGHRARLVDDHRRAAALVKGLQEIRCHGRPVRILQPEIPTNMVYWFVDEGAAAAVCNRLAAQGILIDVVEANLLRAVTHLDVDDIAVERTLSALRGVLSEDS